MTINCTTYGFSDFRGDLSGNNYFYQLLQMGDSSFSKEGIIEDATSHLFQGLLPYTNYSLYVFAKNSKGEYNDQAPLVLEARTQESEEPRYPPSKLNAIAVDDEGSVGPTFQVWWTKPYPETARVKNYELEWSVSGMKMSKCINDSLTFLCNRLINFLGRDGLTF